MRVIIRGCEKCVGRAQCNNCAHRYDIQNIVFKVCPTCKINKRSSEFNKRRGSKIASQCRECSRLYCAIFNYCKIYRRTIERQYKAEILEYRV